MDQFTLADFERAAGAVTSVVAAVPVERLGDPTPCDEWDVRAVINHLIAGNLWFAALATGGPGVAQPGDLVGNAPLTAWQSSLETFRTAFQGEGVLAREFPTSIGPRPGIVIVGLRINEMILHAWDVARATGQPTDLVPDLAEACLAAMRALPVPRSTGGAFGPETPAPAGAPAADRLAAFAGRTP